MFTISTNDKLGMMVEDVRMSEIRDAIAARRLGDEVRNNVPDQSTAIRSRWLERVSVFIAARTARAAQQKVLRGVG